MQQHQQQFFLAILKQVARHQGFQLQELFQTTLEVEAPQESDPTRLQQATAKKMPQKISMPEQNYIFSLNKIFFGRSSKQDLKTIIQYIKPFFSTIKKKHTNNYHLDAPLAKLDGCHEEEELI